jgi:hypothetical protein
LALREKLAGDWTKLNKRDLHYMHCSQYSMRVIKLTEKEMCEPHGRYVREEKCIQIFGDEI